MCLARPIVSGHKLILPQDKVLNSADIESLIDRFPNLHVSIHDPLLDDAVAFEDDSEAHLVSQQAREQFLHTIRRAQADFATGASMSGMDLQAIEPAVSRIVEFLQEHPVIWTVIAGEQSSENLTEHAGQAFYLSMVIGNAIRERLLNVAKRAKQCAAAPPSEPPLPDLAPLGLAALLMDIGLWSLYPVLNGEGPLTPEERAVVLAHPIAGADMLPAETDPAAVAAVRYHHENNDGSGYPMGLAGQHVPLFARILRVADAYSAATAKRAYREAQSPVRALWEMTRGAYASKYDPVVLKVFQAVVQPYPIGAVVRLSCGRHAVVVRHGRHHGLLPEILIAFDEDNKPMPRKKLSGPFPLDRHPELRIVSFRGEDLTMIYGDEPVYEDVCLRAPRDFETLFESVFP